MALKLVINWFTKSLLASSTRGGIFTLPSFTEGDVVPMEITIVEPDTAGSSRYLIPDISNDALSLTVEASDGDPVFVSQPTWNKDVAAGTFSALVDFNTAELDTWLGVSTSATGVMKIKRTGADGSTVVIYQSNVTVVANLSAATPANPLTGTTTLTLEAASAMFAKKIMDPGDTITFQSADGVKGRTLGIINDGSGNYQSTDFQFDI